MGCVLLACCVYAHFLFVVPVPLADLMEGHANLLCDSDLVFVAPFATLFELSD